MYTVELHTLIELEQFLTFLGDCIKTNGVPKDLCAYHIQINPDSTGVLLPGPSEFNIEYNGDTFKIRYTEEGEPCGDPPKYYRRIVVAHPDLQKLQDYMTAAMTYKKPTDDQRIKLYSSTSKGYWDSRDAVYAQTLDNIFIPTDTKSSIIQAIDKFVLSKQRYIEFGRSYKLAFLFTGIPGAGKTSLVKALALHYKRTIYILNFTKAMTDEYFFNLVDDIKDDSILLIEDIDAFFIERKAQDINISFSALINMLDGVLAKGNGLLIFLTANNPDRLDPALVRPGRVDRMIKFDYPKKKEVSAAFFKLTCEPSEAKFDEFYSTIKDLCATMSAIIDYLFRYPDEYMQYIEELSSQTKLYNEIINDKTDRMYS